MNRVFTYMLLSILLIVGVTYADDEQDSSHIAKQSSNQDVDSTQELYMFQAADYMANGDFMEAADIYEKLYDMTKDIYFIKQVAIAQGQAGDIRKSLQAALEYQEISKNYDDVETNLIIAEGHIKTGDLNLAIILLERVLNVQSTPQTHYILANLYIQLRSVDKALQHFLACYNDDGSDGTKMQSDSLRQIIAIYLDKREYEKALVYLNHYLSNNEYDINAKNLGENYIDLYKRANKMDDLINSLYTRFRDTQSIDNAKFLSYVLLEANRHNEAIQLILDNEALLGNAGKEILIGLYVDSSKFNEAASVLKKLYEDTGDYIFLGFSAVYEFESLASKNKETLEPIIGTVKFAINSREGIVQKENGKFSRDDAFLYNFVGYLLIDFDIDIDSGINYVNKALSIVPDSIEYMDSLAWGLYKKGDCAKAKEIFSRIPVNQMQELEELQAHSNLIGKCTQ